MMTGRRYESRDAFYRFFSHANKDLRFCHLLMEAKPTGTATAMPWVIPVLGTGATSPEAVAAIREAVEQAGVRACRTLTDGKAEARRFMNSLIETRLHLSSSRDPQTPDAMCDGTESVDSIDPLDQMLGAALVATARLSNSYHQILSWNSVAPTRGVGGNAVLRNDFPEYATIQSQFVEPTTDSLAELEQAGAAVAADDPFHGSCQKMRALAEQLKADLARKKITKASIRLLSEYCWVLLSRHASPGWSDLLWRLYLLRGEWDQSGNQLGPRPIGELSESVLDRLIEDLKVVTVNAEHDGISDGIHWQVANLLVQQSRYRSTFQSDGGADSPLRADGRPDREIPSHITAFVTSLDETFENVMKLSGRAFIRLFPVHCSVPQKHGGGWDSHLVWIGEFIPGKVAQRGEDFDTPDYGDKWFVSTGADFKGRVDNLLIEDLADPPEGPDGEVDSRNIPVIVRLTGCPLANLPGPKPSSNDNTRDAVAKVSTKSELGRQLIEAIDRADLLEDDLDDLLEIRHAVVINEADLARSMVETVEAGVDHSYPNQLIKVHEFTYGMPFWLLLGVQMNDSSVRNQIAVAILRSLPRPSTVTSKFVSQNDAGDIVECGTGVEKMGVKEEGEGSGLPEAFVPKVKCSGLAVIERPDGIADELMTMLQLDVVRASCDEFSTDLEHYALHLADEVENWRGGQTRGWLMPSGAEDGCRR